MIIAIENLELTRFFLAIAMLLVSAHIFGYIFTKLKMPKVVGEIFGGLILGPTFLGYLVPEFYQRIFLTQGKLLAIIYWLGLILLMFTSGFELEREFSKKDKKTITWLVIGSTIFPLIFGWVVTSFFDLEKLVGSANNILALRLIIVVAIAVTSIPVLSKIFLDLNIITTRFAKIVLTTATFHDVILWVFVSVATSLVSGELVSYLTIIKYILISLSLFVFAILVIPKIIRLLRNLGLSIIPLNYETGFAIFVLLSFVIITNYFNINIVFGAFLGGIVIGFLKSNRFQEVKTQIKGFSLAMFIPIYFAIVGIKLDLIHHLDIIFFIGFTLFAFAAQGIGILIITKLLKYDWKSSINYAIVMNDRGGPCIVLATVAFELGIISENFFVTLVLLAIITSISAGSWLRYIINKGWKVLN
jgi:Kef-type K+ transport system membrane component KefB